MHTVDSNDPMERLRKYIPGECIQSVEDLLCVCRRIRESREPDKEGLVKLANDYFLIGPRKEAIDALYAKVKPSCQLPRELG